MHTFCIQTLVDVGNPGDTMKTFPFTSATGVLVNDRQTLEVVRSQKANFITLQQVLQLRSNITWELDPERGTLQNEMVGSFYEGSQSIWRFVWQVEQADVYTVAGDPIGGLLDDFHQVPINAFLQETVTFPANCFDTKDHKFKNTQFLYLGPTDK